MTFGSPRRIDRSVLTQWWTDVTFLHWRVPPAAVRHLLPAGTRPDVVDGDTFVGLIAFRLCPLGWPALTDRWSFPETNVRLYTIDGQGRRGVVFLSMDAANLPFVLSARALAGLPYMWSDTTVRRDGDEVTYTCRPQVASSSGRDEHVHGAGGGADRPAEPAGGVPDGQVGPARPGSAGPRTCRTTTRPGTSAAPRSFAATTIWWHRRRFRSPASR